jgi:hypothetical protein
MADLAPALRLDEDAELLLERRPRVGAVRRRSPIAPTR